MSKLAALLVRGRIRVHVDILTALDKLRLLRKMTLVIVEDTPSTRGQLQKVKDYITWGEVSPETLKALEEKRKGNTENVYHLNPPRGGFERKGVKKPFTMGGALGNRKDKMNDLIAKML